jgi:hypothetical protein
MTPVIWRKAGVDDADALALLGSATFLATFAFDHPGQPLVAHLRTEHSPEYFAHALAQPGVDIVIGETPLGAPVGAGGPDIVIHRGGAHHHDALQQGELGITHQADLGLLQFAFFVHLVLLTLLAFNPRLRQDHSCHVDGSLHVVVVAQLLVGLESGERVAKPTPFDNS